MAEENARKRDALRIGREVPSNSGRVIGFQKCKNFCNLRHLRKQNGNPAQFTAISVKPALFPEMELLLGMRPTAPSRKGTSWVQIVSTPATAPQSLEPRR